MLYKINFVLQGQCVIVVASSSNIEIVYCSTLVSTKYNFTHFSSLNYYKVFKRLVSESVHIMCKNEVTLHLTKHLLSE